MKSRAFLPVLHFAFLLTGVATTMTAVLLPTLVTKWTISDAQAGGLFGAQFVGSFLGSLAYGLVVRWLGHSETVIAGLSTIALGILGFGYSAWPLPLLFVFVYGFALGVTLPAINLLVASLSPERRSSALNLLNFSWTLGAVTSPLIFVYLLRTIHLQLSVVLAGVAALIAASGALVYVYRVPATVISSSEVAATEPASSNEVWMLTGLLLFLYVGAETSVAGWTPLMGIRHQLLSGISIAFAQSFFWGALLLGRLAASFLWRQTTPRMLISASLATATAGIVLLATTTSRGVLFCGMLLAGAGLAAVFPTTVAVFSPQTRTTKKAFSGVVFAAAGLGGAAVPAFIGIISGHGYSLRLALWLLAAITAIMLLIEQKISRDVARQGVS